MEEGTFELGHREESNPPSGMWWGGEIQDRADGTKRHPETWTGA